MSTTAATFHLYTYFRSSCSARLRIALHYKSLPFTSTYINLFSDAQSSSSYAVVNPSHSVPTLIVTPSSTSTSSGPTTTPITITQSLSALEYLDEAFPSLPRLLPPLSNPTGRTSARTLSSIIACDIQPVTNLRILKRVKALCPPESAAETQAKYAKELMMEGFRAYEEVCRKTAGKFSVGDEVTIADCCLVPAVWAAMRWGLTLEEEGCETVKGVFEKMSGLECVRKAHWRVQEDTPEKLRGSLY